MTDDKKQKALELAIAAVNKTHGIGSLMQGDESVPGVEFCTSGCRSVDKILGGGWPKGRIIEVYGPESSGKTTLTLHAIAEAQKAGDVCAFIDAEHAFDPKYAAALGVDMSTLLISQPDNGEQALDITEALVRSGVVGLVVIDSVAALVPKAELEGAMGDSHMGLQARLMSQAMRKLASITSKSLTSVIFINQLRMKIGIVFGNPEVTSGGNALKFYSSVRVDVRRMKGIKATGEEIDDNTKFVANRTKVKVVKNKVFPPFKEAEITIKYGEGIDIIDDIVDIAVREGIIIQSGSWFSLSTGEKLGQGKAKVITLLKEDPALLESIESQLK